MDSGRVPLQRSGNRTSAAEGRIIAAFPAVISIMKILLDLDAASLTPGKSPKDSRNSAKEEGARFRDESGRRFSKVEAVRPFRYRETP